MREACFGSHAATLQSGRVLLSQTVHSAGLRTPKHAHPFFCLHVVLDGLYHERGDGCTHRLGPGWLLFKPAGTPHENAFDASGALTLRLELAAGAHPRLEESLPTRMTARRAPHLTLLADRARAELAHRDALSPVIVESLALELYAGLARLRFSTPGPAAGRDLAHRCAALLDERFRSTYRLGEAADELGVDRSVLARAFREAFGCSVGEYLRRRRLELVTQRLRHGETELSTLAAEAGFADQSHMTRLFRREFGLPPAAWRDRFGSKSASQPS